MTVLYEEELLGGGELPAALLLKHVSLARPGL